MTLQGLMQDRPLMISSLIESAARYHGDREIVGIEADGSVRRSNYAQMDNRARKMASALARYGIREGDRVATLAWNSCRHFELFFAVSGIGAVLHTINPRLFREQIRYIVKHAGDRILFVEPDLLPLAEDLKDLGVIEQIIVMDAEYEEFIATGGVDLNWPLLDERCASSLCYTSGTTGNPKGVLYSHRSTVLHALAAGQRSAFDVDSRDVLLPMANMYHATAWGWPYLTAMTGAKLVLAGHVTAAERIQQLIIDEGVTLAGGVPTIWTMMLEHLRKHGGGLGKLKRLTLGGSAVPRAIIDTFARDHGVTVNQIWGMTETSPLGVMATPSAATEALDDEQRARVLSTQGRAQYGIELRLKAADGSLIAPGSEQFGDLWVRGPWVASGYFGIENHQDFDEQGWFKTGDVATLDQHGFLTIVDRSKDVIKSGGEWISSIDLENSVLAHPEVRQAAVVGIAHPKWEERPLLVAVAEDGLTKAAVLDFLRDKVVRWWLPDDVVFVSELPLTATGKIAKRELRERYADHYRQESGD